MLERYYVRPDTVDRIQASWISGAIEQYVRWLSERNYSEKSILRRVPLLVGFGEFAKGQGVTSWAELPTQVEYYVAHRVKKRFGRRKPSPRSKKYGECVRNPIQQMLGLILPEYTGQGRTRPHENPFYKWVPGFFDYLRQEKGLTERTVQSYSHYLRQFAAYLQGVGVSDLKDLSPPVLSGFVTQYRQQVQWPSIRNACGVVRVFLRFVYRERALPRDLSGAVEQPKTYRLSNIPRSISWDEVRRMLEAIDRRTPRGKRDYAILLLLVTYGLRAREVAALTLDDIDWKSERLRIPTRKAGHSTLYPLSPIAGQAIIEYLKFARPQTSCRQLFFRTLAPKSPLTGSAISSTAFPFSP